MATRVFLYTFKQSLSGMEPGVPVFRGQDSHGILGWLRSSLQDVVQLVYDVGGWANCQFSIGCLIQHIQLEELHAEIQMTVSEL